MASTDWDSYGTGKYEKCANCMVHCGYEPTAVNDTVASPLKALRVWMRGVDTEKPMAPEISLEGQRQAEYMFEKQVTDFLTDDEKEAAKPVKAGGAR